MRRILQSLLAASLWGLPLAAQSQPTSFAVAIDGAAWIIPAVYSDNLLRPGRPAPHAFARALGGVTMTGAQVHVQLDSLVPNPEHGDPDFTVHVVGTVPPDPSAALSDSMYQMQRRSVDFALHPAPADSTIRAVHFQRYADLSRRWLDSYATFGQPHAVLVWAGGTVPTLVSTLDASVDSALLDRVRPLADSLWQAAVAELSPGERSVTYRVGHSFVLQPVDSPTLRTVWLQAISARGDPRGSFMFVLNGSRVVRASFGHPEWSPNSEIIQLRPYLLLHVGQDPRLFVLCEYNEAWESSGQWLFMEAATGRLISPQ
jgi:hypothetical protein